MLSAVAVVIFWGLLSALYMAFAGTLSLAEGVAGMLVGLSAVAFWLLMQRITGRPIGLRAPWLRLAARSAAAIGRDLVRVAAGLAWTALSGESAGKIVEEPFTPDDGGPMGAGHCALAAIFASIAPNRYVLDATSETLSVHRLVEAPPPGDPRWPV